MPAKRVGFLELFFDLVFVFAITQLVGALADDHGLAGWAVLLAVSFAVVAGLWWCSFDWVLEAAEHHLAAEPDHRRRGHLARDLFTLGHLPIVAGTVVFALAVKSALAHPDEPLATYALVALAVGPMLNLGGYVYGAARAVGRVPGFRLAGIVAIGAWVAAAGPRVEPVVALAGVAIAVAAVAAVESLERRAVGSPDHEAAGGGIS